MKRSPLLRKTPLKAYTGLKRSKKMKAISERKVAEINDQETVRVALCIRCGGSATISTRRTVGGLLTIVQCFGGKCEICGKPTSIVGPLEPHELVSRSIGGILSMDNSRMVCRNCHETDQALPIAERLLGAYNREILEPNQAVEDNGRDVI